MRIVRHVAVFAMLVTPAAPCNADSTTEDEHTLQAAHIRCDGESLLQFFRHRSVASVDSERLANLVVRLGDKSTDTRNAAFAELVSIGPAAIPALRQAANGIDHLETASLAAGCLQLTEGDASAGLAKAAARLLEKHRPAEMAEVLFAYVPYAEDAETVQQIESTLAATISNTTPSPSIIKALADPLPVCRAVAAEALSRSGDGKLLAHVRPLLNDPKPTVRFRVALALAKKHEADAIPVLINLLSELPSAQRRSAEDYLTNLAGEWAVVTPQIDDAPARTLRRDLWLAWWNATDGKMLLDEFRKRTPTDSQRDEFAKLIQQLADTDPAVRDQAITRLIAARAFSAPLLRQVADDEASPIRAQAQHCLQLLHKAGVSYLPPPAARLIALRKPPGAAETLVAYLPSADAELAANEVRNALGALAFRDGQADAAVVKALSDASPIRRAAAAEAICRGGLHDQRDAVRQLLKDADSLVRLKTALALIGVHDKFAVPTLIELIANAPTEQTWQAEEALVRIARDKAPGGGTSGDASSRQSYRDEWTAWWEQNKDSIDLATVDQSEKALGLTLVIEQQTRRANKVLEVNAAGKVRWQIEGLQYAIDAQVLPGERVLVVEQQAGRITERDRKGTIVWQWAAANPVTAQRLPNGNTFVATRQQLVVVDRNGKEVFSHNRPAMNIAAAARLRDGHYVFVTYEGQYVHLDGAGKELKSAVVPFLQNVAQFVEFLPNERLLVAMYNNNKVAEYDLNGKIHWEVSLPAPTSATRLPNGNTLAVSNGSQRIVELNRAGQTVWEVKESIRPWKARRR